jgi:hypothetical protein
MLSSLPWSEATRVAEVWPTSASREVSMIHHAPEQDALPGQAEPCGHHTLMGAEVFIRCSTSWPACFSDPSPLT